MKKDTISKVKDFNSTKEEQITLSKNYKIFEVFLEQSVSGEGMIGEKITFYFGIKVKLKN